MVIRGVLRTLSNIQNRVFCENNKYLSHYICLKNTHLRHSICLILFWMRFWLNFVEGNLWFTVNIWGKYTNWSHHRSMIFLFNYMLVYFTNIPAGVYLLKVNNRNTRKRCEICSKLTMKIPERRRSGIFTVNFEHISHLFLVFPLLSLNM